MGLLDDIPGVKDIILNGVALTRRAKLSITAAGATAVDNKSTGTTELTLSGGGGGVSLARDLGGGDAANPKVVGLYGKDLDAATFSAPATGAVQQYNGTKWVASTALALVAAASVTLSALGATLGAPGVTLSNTTPSAAAGDQYSPAEVFSFNAWDGAASIAVDMGWQALQTANGDVFVRLIQQVGGAGWTEGVGIGVDTISWPEDQQPKFRQSTLTSAGNAHAYSVTAQSPMNTGAGGHGAGGLFTASSGTGTDHDGGDWDFEVGNKSAGSGRAGQFRVLDSASATKFQIEHDGTVTTSLGLGIVHSSVGGVLSSSAIVDADVDAAAAIDGSKITPNFGLQAASALSFAGVFLSTGTPASAGAIRMANGDAWKVATGTGDATIWDYNVTLSGGHTFGDAAVPAQLLATALSASDGTYTHPILPTSNTGSTAAGGPATTFSIACTNGKVQRVGVILIGTNTTSHKTVICELEVLAKTVSGTTTVLATLAAKNPTSGAAPAYDGFGDLNGAASAAGSGSNVVVTTPYSTASALTWVERHWVITEAAI